MENGVRLRSEMISIDGMAGDKKLEIGIQRNAFES